MKKEYMKLSEYAEKIGVKYLTAWRWFNRNLIPGAFQNPVTGTIFVKIKDEQALGPKEENRVILYARVSSTTNKPSLDGQIERMRAYSAVKGYSIVDEYKEVASGINEDRRGLNQIFERDDFDILLVEHKDRLARVGANYIEKILENKNQRIECINTFENEKEDLINDFVCIIVTKTIIKRYI